MTAGTVEGHPTYMVRFGTARAHLACYDSYSFMHMPLFASLGRRAGTDGVSCCTSQFCILELAQQGDDALRSDIQAEQLQDDGEHFG